MRPDGTSEVRDKDMLDANPEYFFTNLDEIQSLFENEKPTGNDIFDEIWFNW